MKICILGIDALEYDLVEKWDLKNLKQSEHGKVEIPLVNNVAITPDIWSCFLTGGKSKIKDFESDSFRLKIFRVIMRNLNSKIFNKILRMIVKNTNPNTIDKIQKRLGLKDAGTSYFPELDENSFLDESNSTYYNAPFYDYNFLEVNKTIKSFAEDEITSNDLKKYFEKKFEKNRKNFIRKINENSGSDLYFFYARILDDIQHHFYMDKGYIKEKYKDIDKFVGEVKKTLPKDTLLLVISDHGTDMKGGHSNHAFYSVNKKLGLKNPHVSDFYDIIMKELKLPTNKDKKQIEQNLKKLGYIS